VPLGGELGLSVTHWPRTVLSGPDSYKEHIKNASIGKNLLFDV
jgi:hypothetical protein